MENKNTGLVVLVIILSLLVIGLGGYIVYDKVLNKDTSNGVQDVNNEISNEIEDETNNSFANNEFDFNTNCNAEYSSCVMEDLNFSAFSQSVEGDNIETFNVYLNTDGSIDINYSIITHSGTPDVDSKYGKGKLSNITNAVQIVKFSIPSGLNDQLIYILLNNGDVYYYRIGDIIDNKFEAIKVDNVKDVKKLFVYSHPKNSCEMIAITSDNKFTSLRKESV